MLRGTFFYEWFSHNLFVLAMVIGIIAAVVYYLIWGRKKGWYR